MKRNKEKSTTKPVDTIDTLVGAGSTLQGNLEFTGGLRIDGHIKGDVSARDSSNGTLVLSESGIIDGNINVPHMIVNGSVTGNIVSSEHLELQSRANVTGDIRYKAVEMQLGAVLNGALLTENQQAPVYDVLDGGKEGKA